MNVNRNLSKKTETTLALQSSVVTVVAMADVTGTLLDVAKIKDRREKLGLSMAQAAAKAGLSGPQQWFDIETGRRDSITLRTLAKVAAALQMSARSLLKA